MISSLQPHGHQREVAPVVDRALAHEGHGDGDVQTAGKGAQLGCGPAPQHAVAGQHDRSLGLGDELGGMGDGLVRGLREIGLVGLDRDPHRTLFGRHPREVLGKLDVGGAGLLQLGEAERLAHDLRNRVDALHAGVPLGHGLEHANDVDELVGFLVELVRAGLSRDRDHWRTVEIGVGDAGHEVGRPGPERRHGDGTAAGQAPMDVGHERSSLLVARRDVPDGVLPGEGIEDGHRFLAGHREDVLAAFGGKAINQEARAGLWGWAHGRHVAECTRSASAPRRESLCRRPSLMKTARWRESGAGPGGTAGPTCHRPAARWWYPSRRS